MRLFGGHAPSVGSMASVFSRRGDIIVVFDVALQGVGAAVEEQVFSHFFFFGVDVCIRRDMRRVDDGHVHASLYAVVKHDRIEHGARMLRQPNDKLLTPSEAITPGQVFFNEANAFDGLNRRVDKFFVASCQCKGLSAS